jgi:predicted GTPase
MPLVLKHESGLSLTRRERGPYDERAERKRRDSLGVRIIIMGAAGRDFHNFNAVFRDDPASEVVAFTVARIPNIEGRRYPPELAGPRYTEGIPIYPEADRPRLIRETKAGEVIFDLRKVIRISKPALRVGYELQEIGKPDLEDALRNF